jgi:hypothetical protein
LFLPGAESVHKIVDENRSGRKSNEGGSWMENNTLVLWGRVLEYDLFEDLEEDGGRLLLSILTTQILKVWAE